MMPTQFVGKIHAITHSIGQSGGTTSVNYVFARTHRGLDDEFLGVMSTEIAAETESKTIVIHPRLLSQGLDPATVTEAQKTGSGGTATEKAKSKQAARTSRMHEVRKDLVRRFADDKLVVDSKIPGIGKVKRITESGGDALLTLRATLALGLTETYFNANKFAADQSEVDLASTEPLSVSVDVIKLPETLTIEYVELVGTGKYARSGLAFEDVARPSWFSSEVWKNDMITEAVYKRLLGCSALTDDVSLGQAAQDEMLQRWETDQTKRITREDTTDQSGAGTTQVESTSDGKFKLSVVEGSVEEAIDGLSLLYGMIRESPNGDVHEFIRDYTRRPIANMVDILGSQNLVFNPDGTVKDPDTMVEGFHSRAFGDYNTDVTLPDQEGSTPVAGTDALFALMEGVSDPGSVLRPGIIGREQDETGIRADLDPRGRARGRVRAYVEELQHSRGLLSS
jgi:hypothetical protein